MIADPQRLQYLEAMGIPTWVSRYRFTNALPTPQSEWLEPERREKAAPGERLHALLERSPVPGESHRQPEGQAPASRGGAHDEPAGEIGPSQEAPSGEPSRNERVSPAAQARALLGGEASEFERDVPATQTAEASTDQTSSAPAEASPLRFSLTLALLDSRWWLFLPGERAMTSSGRALLQQMLGAIGLPVQWQTLGDLRWPLMETPSADPHGEAREGIEVFCAGQARRNGLTVDGAIVIGEEAWAPLILESLAARRWPHPDTLVGSAAAKRDSWPALAATGEHWRKGSEGEAQDVAQGESKGEANRGKDLEAADTPGA